jgi:cytidylate kinase
MIRIITIEREYGSGGADIARKLADRLQWKLWDQAFTDEIARLMQCPRRSVEKHEERKDSLQYRLLRSFMRGSFEGTLNAPRLHMVDADSIRTVTERVVTAIAREGNAVMVGRGSAYHLQGRSDAFHVFVYAPFEEKVRRLRASGRSQEEAAELAETVDRERAEYIREYFHVEWPARHFFHIMINTTMGDNMVVETIFDSVSLFERLQA